MAQEGRANDAKFQTDIIMDMKMPRLGRGKNMSIAKAALVVFYEKVLPEFGKNAYVYSGDLNTFHDIVDVAGANHCSFLTHHQVLSCMRSSSYWSTDGWQVKGWREKWANCYRPSAKGKKYYEEMLKNRT